MPTSGASRSIELEEIARHKLRKFIKRSAPGLGQPIVDLRDGTSGLLTMTAHWVREDSDSSWQIASLDRPSLDKRLLDSVIVECRVFFAQEEDCYLPGIVRALQIFATPERSRNLRSNLKNHVAQVVRDGRLVSPPTGAAMYSGRLEMDSGLGPGVLLSSDQIAMDYIYGVALHEDDAALDRLANLDENFESALFAVLVTLNDLLLIIANVRRQVLHDIENGYVVMEC